MNRRILFSKRNVVIISVCILALLFVILSQLALKSNQANNSKAAESKKSIAIIPPAPPPSLAQQNAGSHYHVTLSTEGGVNKVEIIGSPPQIAENTVYAIYMKDKNGAFTEVDTFVATQDEISRKFTEYWTPRNTVAPEDVDNDFILFKVN